MIELKGMSWDHPRGFDPMVKTASEFKMKYPDVNIHWEKRPLQAFADRPIEEMAFDYDLIVMDHPHVGEASRKNLILELNSYEKFTDQLSHLLSNHLFFLFHSYQTGEIDHQATMGVV